LILDVAAAAKTSYDYVASAERDSITSRREPSSDTECAMPGVQCKVNDAESETGPSACGCDVMMLLEQRPERCGLDGIQG
jgi:hypothetical protein